MLTIESTLARVDELPIQKVENIRKAAKAKLQEVAEKALGADKRLVIRDLLPTDLGYTYNEFPAIAHTADAWLSILQGSVAATIADNVFVVITGCRILCYDGTNPFAVEPIVTALRITSGGSLVAEWDLYKLLAIAGAATTDGTNVFVPKAGITEGPVVISQNITFNVEVWSVVTDSVQLVLEGYICEKEGATLKP